MAQSTLNFTDGVSGYVLKNAFGSYSVSTGWASCDIAKNDLLNTEKRAFFQFDTSSLPDDSIVTTVEFYLQEDLTQPSTTPDDVYCYIGNWVGSSLDASADDFNGGNYMVAQSSGSLQASTWNDLSLEDNDPTGYISLNGTTDIALHCINNSPKNSGRNYNTSKNKCQLRVTYDLPETTPLRALMGVGMSFLAFIGINWNPLRRQMTFDPL